MERTVSIFGRQDRGRTAGQGLVRVYLGGRGRSAGRAVRGGVEGRRLSCKLGNFMSLRRFDFDMAISDSVV
mgnify:CR=1 FL=1